MNASSKRPEIVRVGRRQNDCCDDYKHPAVIVWPTAMALSWLLVCSIGWLVAVLVS
jgi:hypothetical protein